MINRFFLVPILVLLLATFQTGKPTFAAASSLQSSQACTAAGVDVTLTWQNSDYTQQQYLNLGFWGTTWEPGTYASYGPIAGDARSTVLPGLMPGTTYLAVATGQTADGYWDSTLPFVLTTAPCEAPAIGLGAPTYASPTHNQQPIDYYVNASRTASGFAPVRVDFYPYIPNTYTYATCQEDCGHVLLASRSSGSGTCSDHGGIAP